MKTNRKDSAVKSIVWRIISFIALALITFVFTGSWVQASWVAALNFLIFLGVYYFHERAWAKTKWGEGTLKRAVAKMFTYITVLGTTISAAIAYFVTGSEEQTLFITLIYVAFKHILYVIFELQCRS